MGCKNQNGKPRDAAALRKGFSQNKDGNRAGEKQHESDEPIRKGIEPCQWKQHGLNRALRQRAVQQCRIDMEKPGEESSHGVMAVFHPHQAVANKEMTWIVEEDQDLSEPEQGERAEMLNELPSSAGGGVAATSRRSSEASFDGADGVVWSRNPGPHHPVCAS